MPEDPASSPSPAPAGILEPMPHHKLPESCWSCDHCTVYGNEWGCGRPTATACPEGKDIEAKDARTLHLERLQEQRRRARPSSGGRP